MALCPFVLLSGNANSGELARIVAFIVTYDRNEVILSKSLPGEDFFLTHVLSPVFGSVGVFYYPSGRSVH